MCGGAAPNLFTPTMRRANSVRAILRIHRNSGFRKWKDDASRRETRRSARILKGFLGKKEKDLSMKGKRNFFINFNQTKT